MARIVVGVTGSVAAVRTPALVGALRAAGHDARVVATEPALYFFDPGALPAVEDAGPPLDRSILFRDADEWPRRGAGQAAGGGYRREDPVLHIELRRWADLLLIAPLDANSLAKLAYGLSDNLLTCIYRAWDPVRPVLLAPAMNTFMWESPLTCRHLRLLLETHAPGAGPLIDATSAEAVIAAINQSDGNLRICPPQSKRLACGDEGMGAMADVDAIMAAVTRALQGGVETRRHGDTQ